MNISPTLTVASAVCLTLGFALQPSRQSTGESRSSSGEALLIKLADPVYAPIARQLHVTGDVEVDITVGENGTIESTVAISGPRLLYQSSLESANHSQFECKNCDKTGASLRLIYTFSLVPDPQDPCNTNTQPNEPSNSHYPKFSLNGNHVIVIDKAAPCIIDYATVTKKVRAFKCLYLWRCGLRTISGM